MPRNLPKKKLLTNKNVFLDQHVLKTSVGETLITEIRTRLENKWFGFWPWTLHFHIYEMLGKLVIFFVLGSPTLEMTCQTHKTSMRTNEIKEISVYSKIIQFLCKMELVYLFSLKSELFQFSYLKSFKLILVRIIEGHHQKNQICI